MIFLSRAKRPRVSETERGERESQAPATFGGQQALRGVSPGARASGGRRIRVVKVENISARGS